MTNARARAKCFPRIAKKLGIPALQLAWSLVIYADPDLVLRVKEIRKIALATRLPSETTLSVKWIAERLSMRASQKF
jgi:hypothetical protein